MIIKAFPDKITLNPRDKNELGFVKVFDNPSSGITLDFDNLILTREDYARVYDWIYNQQGRFEDIPAEVLLNTGLNLRTYLDLSTIEFTDDEVSVGMQLRQSTDHFFERAKGTSFELMYKKGAIPNSMIVRVPYIIVPEDQRAQVAINILLVLSLTQALAGVTKDLAFIATDTANPLTTANGLAKAIILLAYLFTLVLQLNIALNNLKELFFPSLRYMRAVSDYNLIKQGCEYLGFTLESKLLESLNNIYTMGIPESQPNKSTFKFTQNELVSTYFNRGYPTGLDSTPTLWSLIEDYLNTYNARIFVYDGVVKIEWDKDFKDTADITIKPTKSDQSKRVNRWTYNDDDVWGRKYLSYTTDYADIHSPDNNANSKAEYITQPVTTLNSDLVHLTGLNEYKRPFAWAGRKDGLNKLESLLLSVFTLADSVINTFGGSSNFAGSITARDGVMVIEREYFSVTKKLVLDSDYKQPKNYETILSIDTIYENYHKDLEVSKNTYKIQKMRIPFTDLKFERLLQNNFVNLEGVGVVEVKDISYKDLTYSAEITVKIPDESGFNAETIKIA